MTKKRYRIGTVLKRTYSNTKKNAKKSATIRAIKNTGTRIKKRFLTMIKK